MPEEAAPAVAPQGLEGVVAASTSISSVQDGFLQYRGYNIDELAPNAEYEEVAYLLLNNELPKAAELAAFKKQLVEARALSPYLMGILRSTSRKAQAMDVLRTVISASSTEEPEEADNARDAEYRKAIRLTAKMPVILAAFMRLQKGEEPVAPDPSLGHAANFTRMAFGDKAAALAPRVLNTCFILQAEHGMNASTFAARITAATLADMYASVTSGLGALKGPLHGGATDGTMIMLDQVGSVANVPAFVKKGFENKYKFPGFGHRVYRTVDPRSKFLRSFAADLQKSWKGTPYYDIQEALVEEVNRHRHFPVNVDYYAATTYTFLGIPAELGTSIFAIGRVAGWCAHVMEQHGDNRLIRPESLYTGPTGKKWAPAASR
ncbi:MAG: citrate synthase [Chloroflexi bacterium]|nr:citrate synthase [Chloroflexota bacterium]